MRYKKYLQSKRWKAKRKAAIEQANGRCKLCGSQKNLRVVHNNWDRVGRELISDLDVICSNCAILRFESKMPQDDLFKEFMGIVR